MFLAGHGMVLHTRYHYDPRIKHPYLAIKQRSLSGYDIQSGHTVLHRPRFKVTANCSCPLVI